MGLPPLEAMSIGCPVICSNHKAILEGVGSAAAIFDPYEINEITDTLEKLSILKIFWMILLKKVVNNQKSLLGKKMCRRNVETISKFNLRN